MSRTICITLKGIKIDEIHKKYGLVSNFELPTESNNTTQIDDLFGKKNTISFCDETLTKHNYDISIIHPETTGSSIRPTEYHCFWDRNKIPSNKIPIGCPIEFIPPMVSKTYYSHKIKDTYSIKGEITEDTIHSLDEKDDRFKVSKSKGQYIIEGAFCSFNCVQAFINDNKSNPKYELSTSLLVKIYSEYHKVVSRIIPAGDWKLLKEYGGYIGIDEFRNNFNYIEYIPNGNISMKSIGYLFEEKVSLN